MNSLYMESNQKNTIYEIINETKTTTYKKLYEYNLKKLREIIEDEKKN